MPVRGATIFKTPTVDDPALSEAVRRLVAAYQPERIYLFGSVARTGTAADVLVCTRSYFQDRRSLKASLPGSVLREGRVLYSVHGDLAVR
ncbi:MAG: hypothetical protein LAQ30_04165 [Acidobacteriia bacterium]|nr:hypothetical protein [Terriglobia bacterium]